MKALVVKNPFGGHQRGATVTDPQQVEQILASENAHDVSPTELDEPPAEAAAAAEPAKKKSK